MTTQVSPKRRRTTDYSQIEPLPDPPREPDMEQYEDSLYAGYGLKWYFGGRDDVLVSGEGYLRYNGSSANERLSPDCVVAFGVDPRAIVARNGYVISEVGKPPDFVLEVASRSTGWKDHTVKRVAYARYLVHEYWHFDHTGGRYHGVALWGGVLVGGEYVPVQIVYEPDGLIWGRSEVLGLDLCWKDGELRFRDPRTGEFLPTAREARAALSESEARTEREQRDRHIAEAQAERERRDRLVAEAQAEQARRDRHIAEVQAERERAARQAAEVRAEEERTDRIASDEQAERDRRDRIAAEMRVAYLEEELRRLRGK